MCGTGGGRVLTGALFVVLVHEDGFSRDESGEGRRDDVHHPLMVRQPAEHREELLI